MIKPTHADDGHIPHEISEESIHKTADKVNRWLKNTGFTTNTFKI